MLRYKAILSSRANVGGFYRSRAVKIYRHRSEALEGILGKANDAVVTQRLALSLARPTRPDLEAPAVVLTRWVRRREREALSGLKRAIKDFREAPTFWC
jgi:hypothetical protein